MMKFAGAPVTQHSGKGSQEEKLPHRTALAQLTKGDPMQRSMSNYAKMTPGLESASPSIQMMGPRQVG